MLTTVDEIEVYKDKRGHLFEIFHALDDGSEMAYVVSTLPGFGRDADRWHVHYFKTEIFVCVAGAIHLATYDDEGLTGFALEAGDGMRIVVPPETRHSVMNFGHQPAVLVVLCDEYYDPEDEHREVMRHWSWAEWQKTI